MFPKNFHLSIVLSLFSTVLVAQSPKDLLSNVDLTSCVNCTYFAPNGFFSSETHVVNAFNFARAREESDFSLGAGALGTLTLPSGYSGWSVANRALWLLNAERTARAGKNYSGTTPIGLPYEGIETHLSTIAQNHTQDMMDNVFFAHTSPTTTLDPYERIDNSTTYGVVGTPGACRDFMSYAENIYLSCTSSSTTPTYTVEQAIFSWLYRDAGSAWGHRRAALIQNSDSYGATGFTNNVGSSASEGHLGIGIGTRIYNGTPYSICGTNNAHVVTMNIADPIPSCSANYTVLPIELLSFSGKKADNAVHLNWITLSEKDNAYFNIERSADGQNFKTIGQIKGNGTIQTQTKYTFEDLDPLSNLGYYRLAQFDFDGKKAFSPTIAVSMGRSIALNVFPNPVKDILSVQMPDGKAELLNAQGQIVLTLTNSAQMNVSDLPTGIYVLRARLDGQTLVKKVMKL